MRLLRLVIDKGTSCRKSGRGKWRKEWAEVFFFWIFLCGCGGPRWPCRHCVCASPMEKGVSWEHMRCARLAWKKRKKIHEKKKKKIPENTCAVRVLREAKHQEKTKDKSTHCTMCHILYHTKHIFQMVYHTKHTFRMLYHTKHIFRMLYHTKDKNILYHVKRAVESSVCLRTHSIVEHIL